MLARRPGTTLALCLLILSAVFSTSVYAQQPRVLAPHRPINPKTPNDLQVQPKPVARSLVGGFWTTDPNRKATIYLKNSLEASSITVTPVLWLSNGIQYPLAPVTLGPSGTAVVSVNDALDKQGIASYATLSGYVEVKYTWAWDPICATVISTDPIHSVIFNYGLQPSDITKIKNVTVPPPKQIEQMNAVEGMWWKPEANVTAFVALSNTSSDAVDAIVASSNDQNRPLVEQSVRLGPHVTKVVQLNELSQFGTGAVGGLRVLYSGRGDAMVIIGGLEDQTTGYSATLPFHILGSTPRAESGLESYAEAGLMTGQADPMMAFPSGTVFAPFSVLRNASDQSLEVTPSLFWMQGGVARSARLESFTLQPLETRNLDVAALQADAGLRAFGGSINLVLEAQGRSRSLLMASGSVDQKNNYVFQVAPHAVLESASKSISYWSTASGDDTMVTVWNPADEPQDYVFSLLYTGGHYRMPLQLEARATQTFNISEIIESGTPDAEGNVVPPTVHDGSAMIAGVHADNEAILVVMDAGTYNVRKATCTYYCITCNGELLAYVVVAPFTIPVHGGTNLSIQDQWNTGTMYTPSDTSWKSSNTAVATVGSTGSVTGVAAGSANIGAVGLDYLYQSNFCAVDPVCNDYGSVGSSGSGNVAPTITGANTIWFFNNLTVSGYATSVQLTSSGGSSTTWTVTAGANKVNVSSYISSTITVMSSGTAFSSNVGDITVAATADGVTSSPFSLTTRTPYLSVAGTITTACDPLWGYMTTLNYTVKDQLNTPLPSHMPTNEDWTTGPVSDYNGTNWRQSVATGLDEPGSAFADEIGGENLSLPPTPVPTCDGNSTKVQHWGQEWRVGSIASGFGSRIQTDTIQKYVGHAAHTGIVSPAP